MFNVGQALIMVEVHAERLVLAVRVDKRARLGMGTVRFLWPFVHFCALGQNATTEQALLECGRFFKLPPNKATRALTIPTDQALPSSTEPRRISSCLPFDMKLRPRGLQCTCH
eukprot:6456311-Amphidinium_carterae.1